MPFTYQYANRRFYEVFRIHFGEEDGLRGFVAQIVADEFHRSTGEKMTIGEQVVPHDTCFVGSIPVEVAVTVDCWWSPTRAPHLEVIEYAIFRRLAVGLPSRLRLHFNFNVVDPNTAVSTLQEGDSPSERLRQAQEASRMPEAYGDR